MEFFTPTRRRRKCFISENIGEHNSRGIFGDIDFSRSSTSPNKELFRGDHIHFAEVIL